MEERRRKGEREREGGYVSGRGNKEEGRVRDGREEGGREGKGRWK